MFILDDEAIRLFEVLKKRYSKKKMDHKRACVSSQETFLTKKTQSELDKYNFMRWMEPFIRFRTTKLITDISPEQNVINANNPIRNARRVEEQTSRPIDDYQQRDRQPNRKRTYDIAHSVGGYQDNTHNVRYDEQRISHSKTSVSGVRNSVGFSSNPLRNVDRLPPLSMLHSPEDGRYNTDLPLQPQLDHRRVSDDQVTAVRHNNSRLVQQNSREDINNHHASASPTPTEESHKSITEEGNASFHQEKPMVYQTKILRDEDELFSALIVSEIKNLDEKRRYQVKHKISNVLFDALMEQCEESKQTSRDNSDNLKK